MSVSEIVAWLLGILGSLALFGYRARIQSDNAKFKSLFDADKAHGERLKAVETKVELIQNHIAEDIDEIKSSCKETSQAITEIKVKLAAMPKRKGDQ